MGLDVDALRSALQTDLRRDDRERALWASLSAASTSALDELIRWLARHRPELYSCFADDDDLRVALADGAQSLCQDSWGLEQLLRATTDAAEATWLVVVPVVGAAAPPSTTALGADILLAPANGWPHSDRYDARHTRGDIQALLGAPADVGDRWMVDSSGEALDTRRTSSLVCRVRGTRAWARTTAREQCRLLLASWTLASPPESELPGALWPQVTEWQPQAHMSVEEAMHQIHEDGSWTRRAGATILYGPVEEALWPWPSTTEMKRAVRTVGAVARSRAAAALLAASWHLYLAARSPSDTPWIDRLVHIMHAREVLCEGPDGSSGEVGRRWRAGCEALEVAAALRERGWGAAELHAIDGELRLLRNLAVHGGDVARLRLGHPPLRERTKLDGRRVAGIYVREAASPAYHAVRELCLRLWEAADAADYDDDVHDGLLGVRPESSG